jgi:hypothetical protein
VKEPLRGPAAGKGHGRMTPQENSEFGRRAVTRPGPTAMPPGSRMPPDLRPILIGVATALILGATFFHLMKYAGRGLDRNFQKSMEAVDTRVPGQPINRFGVDESAQALHQTCMERAKGGKLSDAQIRAADGRQNIIIGEGELARGAVYIECFAKAQPPLLFCLAPHRTLLIGAMGQYSKLHALMREAWTVAAEESSRAQKTVPTAAAYRLEQRIALSMPSAVMSPSMLAALRSLAAGGYVPVENFADLTDRGEVREALSKIAPKKAAC